MRTAALVAIGYWASTQVGFALRFPPATTSVLWPPNALLTAALLLVPVRHWWVCLVGALPVHLLVELREGWSLSLVAALFATNCSEALLAAGGVRALSDAPARFDTLRRVAVFIAAAGIGAPILSSFADAAVVNVIQDESYWQVWRTRVFANTLSELSVVPLVVTLATWRVSGLRPSRAHMAEGLLLSMSLFVGGLLVFSVLGIGVDLPGVPRTPTALLLPLFFWAALRLGPAGVSLALLISAGLASHAAIDGSRPFDRLAPADSLIALQSSLSVMAIPLMCVSALLDERRLAMATLGVRLRFEELLSRISASFVPVSSDQMGGAFGAYAASVGRFLNADRVLLMQRSPCGRQLLATEQWTAPGIERLPEVYSCEAFPWALERLLDGEAVVCASIDNLPPEAVRDREAFVHLGLRSALVMPLVASGSVHGAVSLHMTRDARIWGEDTIAQLRLVAEVLATALARKRTEDALRSSELMKSAILASISSQVAVLDRNGIIIAVNESWLRFVRDEGAASQGQVGVGVNYVEVWQRAVARWEAGASIALAGLQDVLRGRRSSFGYEYPCSADSLARWYAISVVPLQRPEGGAVVSRSDVTERKHAEIDVQRTRQELAHFTRVSTLGELTASLAHQLNQPLAGILTNAQAARRFLDASPPDMTEIGDIVSDIIEDDRRAGDVIRRMRDMVSRSDTDPVVLDVNALVRDVAMLITSDTIIRNVSVAFELTPDAPRITGSRVELQQVFLNLLVNAMDAVAECPVAERRVVVHTECTSDAALLVTVADSGAGLLPGTEAEVFEPLFTTKPTGMGMGLAIARSIVEALGGRIWAENRVPRGAAFHITLPLAQRARR